MPSPGPSAESQIASFPELEDVAAVFKGMCSGRLTKIQSAADWLYDRRVVHANNSLARASVRIGGWPMVVARGADIGAGLF